MRAAGCADQVARRAVRAWSEGGAAVFRDDSRQAWPVTWPALCCRGNGGINHLVEALLLLDKGRPGNDGKRWKTGFRASIRNLCCFKALSFVSNASAFGRIVKTNLSLNRFRLTLIIGCILFIGAGTLSFAETLPAPSRSVYKCSGNGVTSYSDAPCLGAKRLEIEPTRGVGKKEGYDIQRERYREMFAEAVRPLTGMDAKQLDIQGRRMKLSAQAQREC